MSNPAHNKYIFIGLIVFVGLGVASFFWLGMPVSAPSNQLNSSSKVIFSAVTNQLGSSFSASTISNNIQSNKYKDGQYTVSINYNVPDGGVNSVSINLTLQNNKITALANQYVGEANESRVYKASFDSMISTETVGKNIDSLNLSMVGGASLTTPAFNQGISKII